MARALHSAARRACASSEYVLEVFEAGMHGSCFSKL